MAAVAQQPQHGNKRSRSGRIIRRPGEIYTPELERFEDDYGSDEYDDDDDGLPVSVYARMTRTGGGSGRGKDEVPGLTRFLERLDDESSLPSLPREEE